MDMAELKTFMQKQACMLLGLTHRFKLSGIPALNLLENIRNNPD